MKAMMFIAGAMTTNLIGLGDELGLYKALKANGKPMTPLELAQATNTHERWTREWLYQQVSPHCGAPGHCPWRSGDAAHYDGHAVSCADGRRRRGLHDKHTRIT